MNHSKIVKYIKSHFKNILDENIKFHEQIIKNSLMKLIVNTLKKQYTLENAILHEHYLINSIEEFNRQVSSESREYSKEIDQIIPYKLSRDNNYLNSKIIITDDMRILPIRIEKATSDDSDDDANQHTIENTNKINIISIEMNNYCGYILYETTDNIYKSTFNTYYK